MRKLPRRPTKSKRNDTPSRPSRRARQRTLAQQDRRHRHTSAAEQLANRQRYEEEHGLEGRHTCKKVEVVAFNHQTGELTRLGGLPWGSRAANCEGCDEDYLRRLRSRLERSEKLNGCVHLVTLTCVRPTKDGKNTRFRQRWWPAYEIKIARLNYERIREISPRLLLHLKRRYADNKAFPYLATVDFGQSGMHVHLHLALPFRPSRSWLRAEWQQLHPYAGHQVKITTFDGRHGKHPVDYITDCVTRTPGWKGGSHPLLQIDWHRKKSYSAAQRTVLTEAEFKERRTSEVDSFLINKDALPPEQWRQEVEKFRKRVAHFDSPNKYRGHLDNI